MKQIVLGQGGPSLGLFDVSSDNYFIVGVGVPAVNLGTAPGRLGIEFSMRRKVKAIPVPPFIVPEKLIYYWEPYNGGRLPVNDLGVQIGLAGATGVDSLAATRVLNPGEAVQLVLALQVPAAVNLQSNRYWASMGNNIDPLNPPPDRSMAFEVGIRVTVLTLPPESNFVSPALGMEYHWADAFSIVSSLSFT